MNRFFTAAAVISLALCVMFAGTAHLYLQNDPHTDRPIMGCALAAGSFAIAPLLWVVTWRRHRQQSRARRKSSVDW